MNNLFSFQVHSAHGTHKASDGVVGTVVEVLTFLESLIGHSASEIFSVILPGISAIANIHPLLVHFPIAFLIAFFIIDFSGSLLNSENWRRLAGGLLYLGTMAAAAAVFAGLAAANTVEHGENVHRIMEKHQFFGLSVLSLSVLLSIWRLLSGGLIKGISNFLFLIFAFILSLLIILGADLGSLMVYKHGVAVEAVEDVFQGHGHGHSHTH